MSETESLVSSIKGGLYDQLLSSIDREFIEEAIVPPAELVPYLKGKKAETDEESRKMSQMYNEWLARIAQALDRGSVPPEEILKTFPEPFKTGVIEAIVKLKDKS